MSISKSSHTQEEKKEQRTNVSEQKIAPEKDTEKMSDEELAIAAGAADPNRKEDDTLTVDMRLKDALSEREESGDITEEEKTMLSNLRNKGVRAGYPSPRESGSKGSGSKDTKDNASKAKA